MPVGRHQYIKQDLQGSVGIFVSLFLFKRKKKTILVKWKVMSPGLSIQFNI